MSKTKLFSYAILAIFSLFLSSTLYAQQFNRHPMSNKDNQIIILEKINAYRASKNLPALKPDTFISAVAEQHSQDMANKSVPFSHQGFDHRADLLQNHFRGFRAIAENIAFTDEDVTTTVKLWLHSTGHRENIEGNYNLTGIGIAYDSNGRAYITQIFVRA